LFNICHTKSSNQINFQKFEKGKDQKAKKNKIIKKRNTKMENSKDNKK